MIELRNVSKIYRTKHTVHTALKQVQLTVAPGEILGVVGRSGAGKSTLIRCINLLEKPTSGAVIVDNMELTALMPDQLREARRNIGMVFQHFNLFATRTAFDNVAFPLVLLNKSFQEIEETVSFLLDKVGLQQYANHYPHELSGGQKQRVAIARALATKPKVLLCDEMTSALDPHTTDDILKLIRHLNAEFNLSIVLITHEMSVIKSIADRVAVIDQGEIIECQPLVDLFKHPKTDVTKRLIESIFVSDLPEEWQSQLRFEAMPDDHTIMRLTFFGHDTLEPVLDELVRNTKVTVSILHANIERLRSELMGRMTIALKLEPDELKKTKHYLENKGVMVEVMGYVDQQTWLN